MSRNWIFLSLVALASWGFWGFFPKMATQYISVRSAFFYQAVGSFLVGIAALWLVDFRPEWHSRGVLFAVLTGVLGGVGALFYLAAAVRGRISVVVTLTALYPLVTIMLARVFLAEPLSLRQGAGMALGLAAMMLMAG